MKRTLMRDTREAAQKLLGKILVHDSPEGRTSGRIVETEAYLANDPASHSYQGKTQRNEQMFGEAGTAYIYLIYGVHHCFNVVTRPVGIGEAVLIRALEPIEGIDLMRKRRGSTHSIRRLCAGPGNLVKAMGISKKQNGISLLDGKLRIERGRKRQARIVTTPRIGLSKGKFLPYRFSIQNNPFVSRP